VGEKKIKNPVQNRLSWQNQRAEITCAGVANYWVMSVLKVALEVRECCLIDTKNQGRVR